MAEKMTSLDTAKRLIEEYSIREFGEMEIDFSDLSKIPVAATTFDEGEPGEYEVSVFLDLVNYQLLQYVNGELYHKEEYNSLEEMVELALERLEFDHLVSVGRHDDEEEEAVNMAMAIQLIEEYSLQEFGDKDIDFSDMAKIPVASTIIGEGDDDEREVQVYLDLENYRLLQYVDDELYYKEEYDSLGKMVELAIRPLDFDLIVSV